MAKGQAAPVSGQRASLRRRGIVRVEVQVQQDDADLVRRVAKSLNDPGQRAEARALLRARFAKRSGDELKALLAAAPLDDIDLERRQS
jgi:hypothetical protein